MVLIFSHNFCIFPKFLILNIFYKLKDLSENTANSKETHLYYLCGKRERGRERELLPQDRKLTSPEETQRSLDGVYVQGTETQPLCGKVHQFPVYYLPLKHKDSSQIIYTLAWFLVFTFKPRVL